MKKLFIPLLGICMCVNAYSQEQNTTELTENQKIALRKTHQPGLSFSTNNRVRKDNINVSSSSVQSVSDVQSIKVKHYYGKQDSLYKEFVYKPE